MSEQAPNTAISALIVVILIFVVAIVFLTLFTDSGEQIKSIFNEVFFGKETQKEEAKQTTVATQSAFVDLLGKCALDPQKNPSGANNCFCSMGDPGVISDGTYLSLQNQMDGMTVTAFDAGDAPITPITKVSYKLGLFVVNERNELGCVFPNQYFIKGVDVDQFTNTWQVYWEVEQTNKWFWESGEDYTFSLYKDVKDIDLKEYEYSNPLNAAPALYKISNTEFCLVTTLIEFPIDMDYKIMKSFKDKEEMISFLSPSATSYCSHL